MEYVTCPICHLYTHQCSHPWDAIQEEWNRQGLIRRKYNFENNLKNMKPRIVWSRRMKSIVAVRKHLPDSTIKAVEEFFDDFYGIDK